jgi:multiple sugar transport system permease protein
MSTATRPEVGPASEPEPRSTPPRRERPAPPEASARRRRGRRRAARRNVGSALLFLSPWIVGFVVFTAWPMIYSAYLSLTDYDVINDPEFIGFENYARLATDDDLLLALGNTVFFTVLQVPLYVIVSLALALLLDRAGRASGFFRTVYFLPKMTPPVAVGVLFLLLFNGQNGLVNAVLGWFGIDGPAWTTDPAWVKPGLVFMSLWTVGASVLILLAALRNVPRELYESAQLDGAGFWRQARSVTLPMISPALFFIVVVNTIAALQTFDEAYTAFFGAGNTTYSNDAALFYVIYLFQQAFQFLNMGYASAMAWLLFVVIMAVTAVQLVLSRRLVYYEGDR